MSASTRRPAPDPADWSPEGMRSWAAWVSQEDAATARRVEHLLAAQYGQLAARGEIDQADLDDVLDALSRDDLPADNLQARLAVLGRRRGQAPRRWVS